MGGRRRCTDGAAGRPAVRQGDPRRRPSFARGTGEARRRRSGPPICPIRAARTSWHADLAAAVDPGGLKREVFGFLPYWELTDSSTRLDWEKLSTIAYFGVGAAGDGTLQKTNSDGSTTVGWSGWTSSRMTGVINAAHANGARVVLTVQSFAWSSIGRDPPEGAARQLGTSA